MEARKLSYRYNGAGLVEGEPKLNRDPNSSASCNGEQPGAEHTKEQAQADTHDDQFNDVHRSASCNGTLGPDSENEEEKKQGECQTEEQDVSDSESFEQNGFINTEPELHLAETSSRPQA